MRISLVFICALARFSLGEKNFGETRTDARGEFTVQAPRGSFVTVSKDDLSKRVEVTTDELVIVVDQMPL